LLGLHRRIGTFRAISHYIVPTRFTGDKLVASGLAGWDRISILGNTFVGNPPQAAALEERADYVVFLGRLSAEKGVWTLLEGIAELPRLRLKILGDGPLAGAVRDLVAARGLDNVELLGLLSGRQKWEVLRSAIATVVPSLCYETFSLAALESQAAGTAVIASDSGSLEWVVRNGETGVLFPNGDATALRARLTWFANNRAAAHEMGLRAREVVERDYSPGVHLRHLVDIYSGVVKS
jgi:glycosyltransferase involved in cell wall biosynthesis